MTPPNSSDAEFFQQRGFGQKLGFGQRPALLIVDMVKAFTNPAMPLARSWTARSKVSNFCYVPPTIEPCLSFFQLCPTRMKT